MEEYGPAFYRGVDYASSMLVGALSLTLPYILIPHGWGMVAMLLGMALAMAAAFIVSISFSQLAAFETAVPGTVISMTVGMFPAHYISDSIFHLILIGLSAGAAVQLLFHLYDNHLHGEVDNDA
jgi:peptidoglycan/LPS O-acetylase OafA/YrhL